MYNKLRRRITNSLGQVFYREFYYEGSLTCAQGEAAYASLTPEQKADLPTYADPLTPGAVWQVRDCAAAPTGDVITDVEPLDPGDAGSSGPIGISRIDPPSEPTIMDLYLAWITVNGQPEAVLKNRVPQPALVAGGQRMWWINGAKDPVVGSWQEQSYPPDTKLNVYYGEGPQADIYDQGYVHKAYQFIYVGQPNT